MTALTFRLRLLLFLYSARNLAGCCLALVGLGLFFLGIIRDWWLPITCGLYAAGWLAAPADDALEFRVRNEVTQANLTGSLDELLELAEGRLPREAMSRLEHIRSVIQDLAPRICSGAMATDHAVALTNAVTKDLPETIGNYLRLPQAFAAMHAIQGGKTCKALLLEQLGLLDRHLTKMADCVYRGDADALLVNGRFLREKFHSLSFVDD